MAYSIEALVVPDCLRSKIPSKYRVVSLPQHFILVPLDDAQIELAQLYQEYSSQENEEFRAGFGKPPESVLALVGKMSLVAPVAYIEAEYFGGYGGQFGLVWSRGKLIKSDSRLSINESMALIGVERSGQLDEFDTLGLGAFRSTRAWK